MDHPLTDRVDQSGFLGNWNELSRRKDSPDRVFPAQQGLKAGYSVLANIKEWLVDEKKLVSPDRLLQIPLQRSPIARGFVVADFKEANRPGPRFFAR